ncbi:MAG: hypothetical protein ACAH80_16555 [Alphaproteobacteria bacterium]
MKPKEKDHKKIVLGASNTPLPVWDPQTGATGALSGPDSGITLYTTREDQNGIPVAEHIYADLMRNLPSRSMLPHLMHELMERDPNRVDWDKHSFLCGYMGPPSIGKSYMIKTLGRLTHPRGNLYLNCKDIDMGTIFCETVFDTSGANREKAAIDAKLLQGNQGGQGLSESSLQMLRNSLGDAYVEEQRDGKTLVSIDWNGIQVKGKTPEEQNYQKQVIREAISQVCQNEGIVMNADAGQIGITTRDGIAIRAADPNSADYGRPILLDELNRAKPGTLQKLYEFFAMLSDPKVDKLQVVGGENRPFTFYRKDLPVSYRMNFTGNPAGRAMGSADMDRPLISRFGVELDIRTVPDPALHDYADRLSQTLTGVPLTQIYYSARPFFDAHPEKLVETARNFRLAGLTEAEKKNVPEEEMLNIAIAPRIIQLSEQLAEYFSNIKHVFNPESQLYRGGKVSLGQEYESYLQGVEIDLRLVTKIIEKASVVPPRMLQPAMVDYSGAFNKAAVPTEGLDLEERLADRGRRLESYLLQWMHQVIVPADAQTRGIKADECQKVLRLAKTIAAHSGVGEIRLKESARGGIERIGDLYDYNKLNQPEERIKALRDLMVEDLRKTNAGLSDDNEKVIPAADVSRAVKQLAAIDISSSPAIFVANDNAKTFGQNPFAAVLTSESGAAEKLAARDGFLQALSVPELREKTLKGLWDKSVIDSLGLEANDEAVKLATKTSASGLGVTTLLTSHNGKDEAVHVFHAPAEGERPERVVVVGGAADKRLKALLKSSGVTYVDSNDITAATTVNDAVEDALVGKADKDRLRQGLTAAFLLRNGKAGEEMDHAAKTPGEVMTASSTITPVAPTRATKRAAPARQAG